MKSIEQAHSAIELLWKEPRATACRRATSWGPSWLAAEPSAAAKTPGIPEEIAPIEPPEPAASPPPEPAAVETGDACSRCSSTEFRDTPIHDGQSVRRDCAICNRTLGFPVWYGVEQPPRETRQQRVERILSGNISGVTTAAKFFTPEAAHEAERLAHGPDLGQSHNETHKDLGVVVWRPHGGSFRDFSRFGCCPDQALF